MDLKTLALALGEDAPADSEEELDGADAPDGDGGDALADDLELAFDPEADRTTRAEAFVRAVRAAMK